MMPADPRISEEDCWWCAGEGTVFDAHTNANTCPFCEGSGAATDGVSVA